MVAYLWHKQREGSSPLVKVPRDVLPAREYFFGLAKVCFLAILVEEKLNFRNCNLENQNFDGFGRERRQNLAIFVQKNANLWHL